MSYSYEEVVVAKVGSGPGEIGVRQKIGPPMGPSSFALDSHGNIFIVDTVNSRINQYSPRGAFLKSVPLGADVAASDLQVDDGGHLFVLDAPGFGSVRQYDPDGKLLRVYTHPGPERLEWLLLDEVGNVLVGDGYRVWAIGNREREFTAEERRATVRAGWPFRGGAYSLERDASAGTYRVALSDGRTLTFPVVDAEYVYGTDFFDVGKDGSIYVVTVNKTESGRSPFWIVVYDAWGRALASLDAGPYSHASPGTRYIVDDAGSVYRLLPLEREVKVAKWQPK